MSNFDEYQKKLNKAKLDPSRKNLKPVDPALSIQQYLDQCIAEGNALLAAEAKKKGPKKNLDDALGEMSNNPYVRARTKILTEMNPADRSAIEKMEKGTLDKDHRYDDFCKRVRQIGDQLSSNN